MKRTMEDFWSAMKTEYGRITGEEPADASDAGIRMRVLAGELYDLSLLKEFVLRQAFPQTATGEYLEKHAHVCGLNRMEAAPAEGFLTFYVEEPLEEPLVIPYGTACSSRNEDLPLIFVTTEDRELEPGTTRIRVPVQAVETGEAYNCPAHTITFMVTPPVGISGVDQEEDFSGGCGGETDEALRKRLLDRWRRQDNGINQDFYRQTALSVPGVCSAGVIPASPGNGKVQVRIYTPQGAPSAELCQEVRQALMEQREYCVAVTVSGAQLKLCPVKVYLQLLPGSDFDAIRQRAEQQIRDWFSALQIDEPFEPNRLGNRLLQLEGVRNYTFESPFEPVSPPLGGILRLGALEVTPHA